VRMTERYIADADPQNILEPPTGGGYLYSDPVFTYYIFSTYDSISTWYNIDMVTVRVKTHCGHGLITDPIAPVVMDADADFE